MNGAKAEPCRAGLWLRCAPKIKKTKKWALYVSKTQVIKSYILSKKN